MDTGMRGTLAERTGEDQAGVGPGAVGGSVTEDSVGVEGPLGWASTGSIFSSFGWTGGAPSWPESPEQKFGDGGRTWDRVVQQEPGKLLLLPCIPFRRSILLFLRVFISPVI